MVLLFNPPHLDIVHDDAVEPCNLAEVFDRELVGPFDGLVVEFHDLDVLVLCFIFECDDEDFLSRDATPLGTSFAEADADKAELGRSLGVASLETDVGIRSGKSLFPVWFDFPVFFAFPFVDYHIVVFEVYGELKDYFLLLVVGFHCFVF